MLKVVHDAAGSNDDGLSGGSLLDEIAREGARQMLAAALLAEVAAHVEAHAANSTRMVTGWWYATASTSRGR